MADTLEQRELQRLRKQTREDGLLIDALRARIASLEETIRLYDVQFDESVAWKEGTFAEFERIERQVKVERREQKEKVDNLQSTIRVLQDEKVDLAAKLKTALDDKSALEGTVREQDTFIQELEQDFRAAEASETQLKTALEAAKAELQASQATVAELQQDLTRANSELQEEQAARAVAEEEARNKEAQLDDAQAELRESQEEKSVAKQSAEGFKAELLSEREKCERLQHELERIEAARQGAVKAANEAAKAAKEAAARAKKAVAESKAAHEAAMQDLEAAKDAALKDAEADAAKVLQDAEERATQEKLGLQALLEGAEAEKRLLLQENQVLANGAREAKAAADAALSQQQADFQQVLDAAIAGAAKEASKVEASLQEDLHKARKEADELKARLARHEPPSTSRPSLLFSGLWGFGRGSTPAKAQPVSAPADGRPPKHQATKEAAKTTLQKQGPSLPAPAAVVEAAPVVPDTEMQEAAASKPAGTKQTVQEGVDTSKGAAAPKQRPATSKVSARPRSARIAKLEPASGPVAAEQSSKAAKESKKPEPKKAPSGAQKRKATQPALSKAEDEGAIAELPSKKRRGAQTTEEAAAPKRARGAASAPQARQPQISAGQGKPAATATARGKSANTSATAATATGVASRTRSRAHGK